MLGRLKTEFKRKQFIVPVLLLAAVGALGFYFLLYRPLLHKLNIQASVCRELEGSLDQARRLLVRSQTQAEERSFFKEEEVSPAIDELTRQGKLKGINFISITPKSMEKSKDARFQVVPLEIETESSYETLGRFLGVLEDLKTGLVTVASLNVTSQEEDASRLRARLILHMYVAR